MPSKPSWSFPESGLLKVPPYPPLKTMVFFHEKISSKKKYAMILFSIYYQFINFKNMAFFTSAPNMLAASWAILLLKTNTLNEAPTLLCFYSYCRKPGFNRHGRSGLQAQPYDAPINTPNNIHELSSYILHRNISGGLRHVPPARFGRYALPALEPVHHSHY